MTTETQSITGRAALTPAGAAALAAATGSNAELADELTAWAADHPAPRFRETLLEVAARLRARATAPAEVEPSPHAAAAPGGGGTRETSPMEEALGWALDEAARIIVAAGLNPGCDNEILSHLIEHHATSAPPAERGETEDARDEANGWALEVLCRVFDDGAEAGFDEWRAWYQPDQWWNPARALGAFVRRRLDRLAAGSGATELDRLTAFVAGYLAGLGSTPEQPGYAEDAALAAEEASVWLAAHPAGSATPDAARPAE